MKLAVTIFLAVALLVASAPARAADDARAHYERAESAYALGDYTEAAKEYEVTFKLKPQPALLFNAAQAHRLAGNKERALQLYVNYLRVYGERVPNRKEVEAMIGKLERALEADLGAQTSGPVGTQPLGKTPPRATAKPPLVATPPVPAPPRTEAAVEEPRAAPVVAPVPAAAPQAIVVPPAPAPVPLARRGVFWGVLVPAVLVVAGAVTVGAVLGTRAPDPAGSLAPFAFGGR